MVPFIGVQIPCATCRQGETDIHRLVGISRPRNKETQHEHHVHGPIQIILSREDMKVGVQSMRMEHRDKSIHINPTFPKLKCKESTTRLITIGY